MTLDGLNAMPVAVPFLIGRVTARRETGRSPTQSVPRA
jgi:hypothetical protein